MKNFEIPVIFCVLSSIFAGCATPHIQFRTEVNRGLLGSFAKMSTLSDNDFKKIVGERIVENYKEFSLSVIEFDDQGKFWDRRRNWSHCRN